MKKGCYFYMTRTEFMMKGKNSQYELWTLKEISEVLKVNKRTLETKVAELRPFLKKNKKRKVFYTHDEFILIREYVL